jgi:PAS domain S-box-containing protein
MAPAIRIPSAAMPREVLGKIPIYISIYDNRGYKKESGAALGVGNKMSARSDPVLSTAILPKLETVDKPRSLASWPPKFVLSLFILLLLYLAHLRDPVLSHSLAEMFSIIVALGIFMLAWNARDFVDNQYFLFLGIAYLFVGALDYLHAHAFHDLFRSGDPNLYIQLWFCARYVQSVSLLVAPLFTVYRLRPGYAFAAFSLVSLLLLASIRWGVFPDCWVPGLGLTRFKVVSDYLVVALQLGAIGTLFWARTRFDREVFNRLVLSILFSVAAELSAVLYADAYIYNSLVGHFLKVISFYLMYKAIIETGLRRPYAVLFRNLKKSEEAVRTARDGLELRVGERTAELSRANERLEKALADAKGLEEERGLTIDLLHLINSSQHSSGGDIERVIEALTSMLRERSGCEAVAIRCRHGSGDTYIEASCRTDGSVRTERSTLPCCPLPEESFHGARNAHHECVCRNLFSGRFELSLPFFTPKGTFWTNSVSELSTQSAEGASGGRCSRGYESVVFVPLQLGAKTFGVLQLSDGRKGRFSPEFVARIERVADNMAVALGRLLAEEALCESEDRFRSVVEHSPVAKMIVWEGRIIFTNPAQERLFGPQAHEIAFRDVGEIYREDQSKFDQLCATMMADRNSRQTLQLRFCLSGPTGEKAVRWMHCQTNPIDYRGKKATLVTMVDITRVKELEQFVATRENLASIGQLATGIAHEVRNPLSGLNLNLSTLEHVYRSSDGLDAEQKERVGLVIGQAKAASTRIASVIQRVMDFAKQAPPKLDLIDVNRVVEAAAEFSLAFLRRRGIELQKTLEPDGGKCFADFRLLEQVLLNLITNAVEAMEDNTGPKRLELMTAMEGGKVVITLSDSGPGVPSHLSQGVSEPFYTTRTDGYGVGLSFSHRIIADHGGRLTVCTSRWGGAEFRIELPLRSAALE